MNYYSYACFLASPEKLKVETPKVSVEFSLESKEDKNLTLLGGGQAFYAPSFLLEEDDLIRFLYNINTCALGAISCANLGQEKAVKIAADLSLVTSKFAQEVAEILNREA